MSVLIHQLRVAIRATKAQHEFDRRLQLVFVLVATISWRVTPCVVYDWEVHRISSRPTLQSEITPLFGAASRRTNQCQTPTNLRSSDLSHSSRHEQQSCGPLRQMLAKTCEVEIGHAAMIIVVG